MSFPFNLEDKTKPKPKMTNEQAKAKVKKLSPLDHQVIYDTSYANGQEYYVQYSVGKNACYQVYGTGNSWEAAFKQAKQKCRIYRIG